MRLICPQCNALYDVPGEMIPPEGREVECSACGNVWHQPAEMRAMRGLASDLRAARAADAAPKRAAPAPELLGAAPELRRPLPEDVLSILREETALELSARRAIREEAAPPAAPAGPLTATSGDDSPATKPTAVSKPAPPPPAPKADEAASAGPEASVDWPATTLTAPDESQPRILVRPEARAQAGPVTAPVVVPVPILARAPQRQLADDALPQAAAEEGADRPPLPPPPRRRVAKSLPDVERLAATLQTQPSLSDAVLAAPPVVPTGAAQPGYRAGFARAIAVSALLLAVYLVASGWVRAGSAPAPVAALVGGVDAARAGLQDLAMGLIGKGER